jgi:uncharacterized protein YegP (UPF0339 family)
MFTARTAVALLAAGLFATAAAAADMKFEIYKDKSDEFRWRLKGGNGETLATAGQGYKAKEDARKGAELLIKSDDKSKFEVYEDEKKEFRWRLKAGNNQVVATSSEGYKDKAVAEKALKTVREGVAKATVEEAKDGK